MDTHRATRITVGDTLPAFLFESGGLLVMPADHPPSRGLVLFLLRAFT